MNKAYTTGQVAKMLGVNINTVIKWFDDGRLGGFRLPGGTDRRIPFNGLKKFMEINGIPLDILEELRPIRRLYPRVDCVDPVSFSIVNGHLMGPYAGFLKNVSLGGACLSVQGKGNLMIPTSEFYVDLQVLAGTLKGLEGRGRIVHLHSGANELAIGLQFTALSEPSQRILASYIN